SELEGVAPEPGEPRFGRGRSPESVVRDQLRCLAAVDEGLGQLLAALEASGQLNRTLVIYTSDNGYLMGEHGRMDDKRWPYEPSVRVPLVVRYPALAASATVCDRLTVNVDLAPTMLELAGVESPLPMHGSSMVPLLCNPTTAGRTAVLTEYFLEKVSPQVPSWQAVRTDEQLYVRYDDHPEWDELYDLRTDPGEERNIVASTNAETVTKLQRELDRLLDAAK
ncbi:MAG TPA: sulfatase/phosphatase domain-containing protein, partial [Pirellulales bacterium]|nr:sulfatase/phosphatase domain-containing protein [Pirellulales bacterium]